MIGKLPHLAQRFFGSLSARPPRDADLRWVAGILTPVEAELWARQRPEDLRHTVRVARRFAEMRPHASRDEIAGALLHDIGKIDADLGSVARSIATALGTGTAAMRRYLDHERIGAEMLRQRGVSEVTCQLVLYRGPAAETLREADY